MAVGDDAALGGYPLVPNTGEAGRVRFGAQEINRTRDYVAQVKALIVAIWPVTRGGTGANTAAGARTNLGITSGTADPVNGTGTSGDIYFKIIG